MHNDHPRASRPLFVTLPGPSASELVGREPGEREVWHNPAALGPGPSPAPNPCTLSEQEGAFSSNFPLDFF